MTPQLLKWSLTVYRGPDCDHLTPEHFEFISFDRDSLFCQLSAALTSGPYQAEYATLALRTRHGPCIYGGITPQAPHVPLTQWCCRATDWARSLLSIEKALERAEARR